MNAKSAFSILVLALAAAACKPTPYEWHGTVYEPARPAAPIALQVDGGSTFDLSQESGRAVILYFGYIHCPDICPATLANLAWVREQLGEKAVDFTVLFATIDPERDTLDRLAEYLSGFNPAFIGLRGDRTQTELVLASYGAYAGMDEADALHEIEHSARLFLIDQDGRLVAHYLWDVPRADLLADIEHLLSS